MRKLSLLPVFILALMLAPACGGGDDDDDDDVVEYDAATTPDYDAAPVIDYDAAPAESADLGKPCTALGEASADCVTEAPDCISLAQPNGFCSLSCGTSDSAETLPAGGNEACQGAYTAGTGTPACALYIEEPAGTFNWSCAILCGNYMGTELGNCPGGLTCQSNICDY